MERDVWRWIAWALKRLPRRWPTRGVYSNREILAIALWAAMHDRSIWWACQRINWPVQAWRRRLPDQSTLSRRLRDPALLEDFERLVDLLQRHPPSVGSTLLVDGKPLPVSEFTSDPEAVTGWGAGRHAKGYKLHALIDEARRLLAWDVRPMKDSEQAVACDLIVSASRRRVLPPMAILLGDANYDSRHLYKAAAAVGLRLVAQRRLPGRGIAKGVHHHPHRLEAIAALENDPRALADFKIQRAEIERYFGTLASVGGGLHSLPSWVRRLHRTRLWVGAKLTIHVARCRHQRRFAA